MKPLPEVESGPLAYGASEQPSRSPEASSR